MIEPDWVPEGLMDALRERVAQDKSDDQRRAELARRVADIPGPLGELLRTIGMAWVDFLDAYEMRGTTEAEAIRMEKVMDRAVEFEAWFRVGA